MFPSSRGIFCKFTRLGALTLTIGFGSLLAFGAPASAATIGLDFILSQGQADALGKPELGGGDGGKNTSGNKGVLFEPTDKIDITARGDIKSDNDFPADPLGFHDFNPNAAVNPKDATDAEPNTIQLTAGNQTWDEVTTSETFGQTTSPNTEPKSGLGVRMFNGKDGSTGISGKGAEENEEVIFTFTNAVEVDTIVLGLNNIVFDLILSGAKKLSDPILFLIEDLDDVYTASDLANNLIPAGKFVGDYKISNYEVYNDAFVNGVTDPGDPNHLLKGDFSKGIFAGDDAFKFNNNDHSTLMGSLFFNLLGSSFTTIEAFILRESNDELYIGAYAGGTIDVIPLPAGFPLFLTGLASLYYMRRLKLRSYSVISPSSACRRRPGSGRIRSGPGRP